MRDVDYSIVIPVYYNEGCLIPLMQALETLVFQANAAYAGEVIFVDDGSGDRSLEELRAIQAEYPDKVTVVKLTRNFGQARALLAGYRHAGGKCVITMSADGQEPPKLINEMLSAFFEENYEVVICARAGRDESRYRIITSHLFYYLLRKLTFDKMPKGGFDFWLLGRRALASILRNTDPNPFLQAQVMWMGFRTKTLHYRRRERLAGVSRFTLAKKLNGLLAGVLEYSFAPIRIMSLGGVIFSLLGFLYAALIFIDTTVYGNPVKGWAPLMIIVLVMGGFQMVMLGIIGEYLWRTFAQVRRRDHYLIEAVYEAERPLSELHANPSPADR
jgi:glycosyltransferase involved in cell wall biosynthesis